MTIAELADEPFVTTRKGHWQRTLLDRLFASEGLTPCCPARATSRA